VYFDVAPATLDFDTAASFGVDPEALVDDDRSRCQAFAEQVRTDPSLPRAFIVPSAALPGTRNVVVFDARVLARFERDPVSERDAPSAVAGVNAQALETLLPLVRHVGSSHQEFEEWSKGNAYTRPLVALDPLRRP